MTDPKEMRLLRQKMNEERKDEMKNRISMALKDPILQQGFEIICKNLTELKKENAELKEQGDKWFVFETEAGNWGMDIATQYTVDRHNYFYGTENECLKWSVEHKIKDYTGHKYCYDRLYEQLEKAKELLKQFLVAKNGEDTYKAEWETEQFLKEIKENDI